MFRFNVLNYPKQLTFRFDVFSYFNIQYRLDCTYYLYWEWATDATILPGGNRRAGAPTTGDDPSSPLPAAASTPSPFHQPHRR